MSRATVVLMKVFTKETIEVMIDDLKKQIVVSDDVEVIEELMKTMKALKLELKSRESEVA